MDFMEGKVVDFVRDMSLSSIKTFSNLIGKEINEKDSAQIMYRMFDDLLVKYTECKKTTRSQTFRIF